MTTDGFLGVKEPEWALTYSDADDQANAHEYWRLTMTELREQGTLSSINGAAVERLVVMRIVFDKASRHVAEHGAVTAPNPKLRRAIFRQSPHYQVMMQTATAIERAEAELGLSPRRRGSTTKVDRKQRQQQAADAYIRKVS